MRQFRLISIIIISFTIWVSTAPITANGAQATLRLPASPNDASATGRLAAAALTADRKRQLK